MLIVYVVMLLTFVLPVAVVLGTLIGVPIWAIRRFRRQAKARDRAVTVVIAVVAIPVLIVVGELASVGILKGLHAIVVPKEDSQQQEQGASNTSLHGSTESRASASSSAP